MVKLQKATAMERLLREGFFETKEAALPFLMSGAVYCGDEPVRIGGQRVPLHLPMTVRGLGERYVGKGGHKLEGALEDFGVDVHGRVCIDAGACTGGFTDCLLQHGAEKVYAVEAGYGQLAGKLQQNTRVVNLEKTNIGEERLLHLEPVPALGSVDLSYLSLLKAVPQFRAIMQNQGELLCLVKPLFETENASARRTGNISPSEYSPLLLRTIDALNTQAHTQVRSVTNSRITGNHGTHEFFLHVVFGQAPVISLDWKEPVALAVARAMALRRYEK